MVKRQQRSRNHVVPLEELGFNYLRSDEARTMREPATSPERTIIVVSRDLGYIEEVPSCLERIKQEQIESEFGVSETLYDKRIHYGSVSQVEIPTEQFDEVSFEKLKKDLTSKSEILVSEKWMERALIIPLGPDSIRNILQKKVEMEDLTYKLLVLHSNFTVFLVIDPANFSSERKRELEDSLKRSDTQESVILSSPTCEFQMLWQKDKDPEYIATPNKSNVLLIFDNLFLASRQQVASVFYEDLLGCQINSTRILTAAEKKILKEKTGQFESADKPMRVLEFNSVEERNMSLQSGRLACLNVLFKDTANYSQEISDKTTLKIEFSLKMCNTVLVTLSDEMDRFHAIRVFDAHYLKAERVPFENESDPIVREVKKRQLVVSGFKPLLALETAKICFVKQIAGENGLHLEHLETIHTENLIEPYYGEAVTLRQQLVNKCIWIEEDLYDINTPNQEGPPRWKVERKNLGPTQDVETFEVSLATGQAGISYVSRLVYESNLGPSDRWVMKLTPSFQKSFTVTKALRIVLDNETKKLDDELRGSFAAFYGRENVLLEHNDADYYEGQIFEEWNHGDRVGTIGVRGWAPGVIEQYFDCLKKLYVPTEFPVECCPELLYGVGERFAMSLQERYAGKLLVDVDKYRERILLIGDAADVAMRDLENYTSVKETTEFKTVLNIEFPYFNDKLRILLTAEDFLVLKNALGVKILDFYEEERLLMFRGSIRAFQLLTKTLEELNDHIFELETDGLFERHPDTTCQICLTEVGYESDFFRLHCGHVMCRACTHKNIESSIDDSKFKIKCVAFDCEEFFNASEIAEVILGGWNRIREFDAHKTTTIYSRAKLAIVKLSDHMAPCVSVDCPGVRFKSEGSPARWAKCDICPTQYCPKCLLGAHKNRTCQQELRYQGRKERSVAEYIRRTGRANFQDCPRCNYLVEKVDGCNHMICSCGTHFCWVCLCVAATSGDCYRHLIEVHGTTGVEIDVEELQEQDGIPQQLVFEMIFLEDEV